MKKFVVEAGSDIAAMAVFDTAALPADFDATATNDPVAAIRKAQAQGRALLIETDSDGSCTIHLYVGDALPDEVRDMCSHPQNLSGFLVPSGTLWVCGAEEVATEPQNPGNKHRLTQNDKCEVQPGTYSATIWLGEWDEDDLAKYVISKVGETEWTRHQRSASYGCWSFIIAVIAVIYVAYQTYRTLTASAASTFGARGLVVLWILMFVLMKTFPWMLERTGNPEIQKLIEDAEKEFPRFVIHLKPLDAHEQQEGLS